MQSRSVQLAPIDAPRITTALSIVVPSPTLTSCWSTARPPICAPAAIRQPLSTSAAGTIRPSFATPSSTQTKPLRRSATSVLTVPSRMSKVASR